MRIHRSLYFQKPKPEVERYSLDTLLEIRTLYADAGASNVSVMFEQTGSSYGNLELIATFDSYAHLGEVSKHQRNHRRLQEIKERPGSTGLELVSSWTSDIVAIFGSPFNQGCRQAIAYFNISTKSILFAHKYSYFQITEFTPLIVSAAKKSQSPPHISRLICSPCTNIAC